MTSPYRRTKGIQERAFGEVIIPHPEAHQKIEGAQPLSITKKLQALNPIEELKGAVEAFKSMTEEARVDLISSIQDIAGDCSPLRDPELREAYEQSGRKVEELVKAVAAAVGEQSAILYELVNTIRNDNYIECRMAFREGLRDGFRLAIFLAGPCS